MMTAMLIADEKSEEINSVTKKTYKSLSEAEKKAEEGLRFMVNFDGFTVNADVARGQKDAILKSMRDVSLMLRGNVGFDGKNAFSPLPHEDLTFNVKDNVSIERGTVSLWLKAENYAPEDAETNGQKRGNISLCSLVFRNANTWVRFDLYEFRNNLYLIWRSSLPPHEFGAEVPYKVPLQGIKKGEWVQVAFTWDKRDLALFLNGEQILPLITLHQKAEQTYKLQPDKNESYIGIRTPIWGGTERLSPLKTVADDFKIYDRALSPVEIKKQYWKLVASAEKVAMDDFDMELAPVNDMDASSCKAAVFLNFNALPEKYRNELKNKGVKADWKLTGSENHTEEGSWTISKLEACEALPVTKQGLYKLDVKLAFSDGKTFKATKSIERPDLAFLNSKIGEDNTVPVPWTPLSVDAKNTVSIWNRQYLFDGGPFPSQILIAGQPLFLQPPTLVVQIPEGLANIKFKITSREVCPQGSYVIFNGEGKASGFSMKFRTQVEFDGFISSDFTFEGAPFVNSMKLVWRVRLEFAKFLLTPKLAEDKVFEEIFPPVGIGYFSVQELWLVSGKGGFCWTAADDANWRSRPKEKVLKAVRSKGLCEVTMISCPVKMPKDASYNALFIVTPTRPMVMRGGPVRTVVTSNQEGEMLTSVGSFDPDPVAFSRAMQRVLPHSFSIYGMGHALTCHSDIARYFEKYWTIPGDYTYTFNYKQMLKDGEVKEVPSTTISCCPNTNFSKYFPYYIDKLFKQRYGDRFRTIYIDLGDAVRCSNKMHNCTFKDKFGREINKSTIMGMRRMIKSLVRLCHGSGRTLMLHAQTEFFPFYTGLADYWYPGEQYGSMLKRNPYAYTDNIPDSVYMSEHCSDILGGRVIFLPALGASTNPEYCKYPEYTEAMLVMLLAHNIQTRSAAAVQAVTGKVWDIFDSYRAYESRPHLYYEQQEVKSANPAVRITWHECPDKKFLLALCNKDPRELTTEVDVSALGITNITAREEYKGTDVAIVNGKFNITLPARSFRLVGFGPEPEYRSYAESMDQSDAMWGISESPDGFGNVMMDNKIGHDGAGSQMIDLTLTEGGTNGLWKDFPYIPGKYTAEVYCRTEGLSEGAEVTFSAQLLKGSLVKTIKCSNLNNKASAQWQKIEIVFNVPAGKGESEGLKIRYLLMVNSARSGKVWFDDFKLKITPPESGAQNAGIDELNQKFTYSDLFREIWGSWKTENGRCRFLLDKTSGHGGASSLLIDVESGNDARMDNFCFLRRFDAVAGDEYTATVWVKTEGLDDKAEVIMAFQFLNKDRKFLPIPLVKTVLTEKTGEWNRLVVTVKIPRNEDTKELKYIMCTLVVKRTTKGQVWFSNFELTEH